MAALYVLHNLFVLMQKEGTKLNPWDTCDNRWTASTCSRLFLAKRINCWVHALLPHQQTTHEPRVVK
jgi:hypothetical protein